MRRKLTSRPFSCLVAALAVAVAAAGCGGDASGESGEQAYGEILSGLRAAALANDATYEGAQLAEGLPEPERVTLEAFCETAWQLDVNRETAKLAHDRYIIHRIKKLATYNLTPERRPPVAAAMTQLREAVDLGSIDAVLNSRYKRACLGSGSPGS
jgi:hypothetical protein